MKSVIMETNDQKVEKIQELYDKWAKAVIWLRAHVRKFSLYAEQEIIPQIRQSILSKKKSYTERFIYMFNIFLAEYSFLSAGEKKLKLHEKEKDGSDHTSLQSLIVKLSGKKFSSKKAADTLELINLKTQNWNSQDIFGALVEIVVIFKKAIKDISIDQNSKLNDAIDQQYIISYEAGEEVTKINNDRSQFKSRDDFRNWFENLLVQKKKATTVETNTSSLSTSTINKCTTAVEKRPPASRQLSNKPTLPPVIKHTTVVNDDDDESASMGDGIPHNYVDVGSSMDEGITHYDNGEGSLPSEPGTAPAAKKRAISVHDEGVQGADIASTGAQGIL